MGWGDEAAFGDGAYFGTASVGRPGIVAGELDRNVKVWRLDDAEARHDMFCVNERTVLDDITANRSRCVAWPQGVCERHHTGLVQLVGMSIAVLDLLAVGAFASGLLGVSGISDIDQDRLLRHAAWPLEHW